MLNAIWIPLFSWMARSIEERFWHERNRWFCWWSLEYLMNDVVFNLNWEHLSNPFAAPWKLLVKLNLLSEQCLLNNLIMNMLNCSFIVLKAKISIGFYSRINGIDFQWTWIVSCHICIRNSLSVDVCAMEGSFVASLFMLRDDLRCVPGWLPFHTWKQYSRDYLI